jgi:undecaprenyl-diphosphatase
MIPGVSRSGATIVGGLLLGLQRKTIVEFSFLLAVPTMLAATGFDLLKNYSAFSSAEFGSLAVGFIAAFAVALFAIRFLLSFIRQHSFVPFGVYRILVGGGLLVWLVIR